MAGKRGGNKASAANGRLGGRPPQTDITKLAVVSGKVRVRIDPAKEMVIPVDPETRLIAQRLMLREWSGVTRIEELFAYAVRRLAKEESNGHSETQ